MFELLIWAIRNRWKTAILVVALLSGVYYVQNTFQYYDTMRLNTEKQHANLARQLAVLHLSTDEHESDIATFKTLSQRVVDMTAEQISRSAIVVIDSSTNPPQIIASVQGIADSTRTEVKTEVSLGQLNPDMQGMYLIASYWNRPPMATALLRAWVWSLPDLIKDPASWAENKLYKRSFPFWVPFVIFTGFIWLILRLISEYLNTRAHAAELGVESLMSRLQIKQREAQELVDDARAEIESIRELLQEAEEENQRIHERASLFEQELIEKEEKLKEAEYTRDEWIAHYEKAKRELENLHQEAEIGRRFRSRYEAIKNAEKIVSDLDAVSADNISFSSDDSRFKKLQRYVADWVVSRSDGPQETWSEHGKYTIVVDAFYSIDQDFRRRFFVHAQNSEYGPHHRRTITVQTDDKLEGRGSLRVVLNDDAGRALCLRYELRKKKGVPAVEKVGFALAVMLRSVHKDFESYQIR